MLSCGDLADLPRCEGYLPELGLGVLGAEEVDGLAVGSPDGLIDVVLEALGEVGLLA